jgi:hypothetical protein
MDHSLESPDPQDFDEISHRVRTQLSWRLEGMLKLLDQTFLDDPTSVTAGMVSAYTSAVKTYASLWRAADRPVDKTASIPASVVEKMLEDARTQGAHEALEAERARVREESARALGNADSAVRASLERVRSRRELRELGSPGGSQ